MTDASAIAAFYHDVPAEVAARAVTEFRGQPSSVFTEPWPLAAWPAVPTRYVLCREDRLVRRVGPAGHRRPPGDRARRDRRQPLAVPVPTGRAGRPARTAPTGRLISTHVAGPRVSTVTPEVPTSITEVFDRVLATDPDRGALVSRSRRLSYAELDREANRAAYVLRAFGVRPGDRVAAGLPNDSDVVIAFHGAMRLGAVWVGVNRPLAPPEKAHIARTRVPACCCAMKRRSARPTPSPAWPASGGS